MRNNKLSMMMRNNKLSMMMRNIHTHMCTHTTHPWWWGTTNYPWWWETHTHTQPIHDDEKHTHNPSMMMRNKHTIDHHYWWSQCNYKGCSPKHNRLNEKPNPQFDWHVFTSSSRSIPPLQVCAFKATPEGQKCTSEVVLVYTVHTPELCWSKGSSQGINMLTSKVLT